MTICYFQLFHDESQSLQKISIALELKEKRYNSFSITLKIFDVHPSTKCKIFSSIVYAMHICIQLHWKRGFVFGSLTQHHPLALVLDEDTTRFNSFLWGFLWISLVSGCVSGDMMSLSLSLFGRVRWQM